MRSATILALRLQEKIREGLSPTHLASAIQMIFRRTSLDPRERMYLKGKRMKLWETMTLRQKLNFQEGGH